MGILYCMELESPPHPPPPGMRMEAQMFRGKLETLQKFWNGEGGGGRGRVGNSAMDWQQPTGFQIFFFPQQWAEKRQTAFGDEVGG